MEEKFVVSWRREEKELTLDGLTVITYALELPHLTDFGRGGRRISAYYHHLAERLRRRWQGEGYVSACLDYASCNDRAQQFEPWRGELLAQSQEWDGETLTLKLQYGETRGGNRGEIQLCDRWRLPWGAPILEEKKKAGGEKIKLSK